MAPELPLAAIGCVLFKSLQLLEPGDAVASGVCMRWAGTAAGCVAAGAAVCLALGNAVPLLAVLLRRLVTA